MLPILSAQASARPPQHEMYSKIVVALKIVLKIIWLPKKAELGETKESGAPDGHDDHSLNERSFKVVADSSSARHPSSIASRSPSLFDDKPSIAAATVLGVVAFAALLFLAIWYIRHKRRRRKHKLLTHNQDFGQSEITLGPDTSKTLDDFPMKDVPLGRASFMFSRSESPSITFVVDEAERSALNKCYSLSTKSLSKIETITRISTDGTRPSLLSSEFTATPSLQSTSVNASFKPASTGSATPRASMSSSQLWTKITSSTECPSLNSREIPSTAPPTSGSSQVWTTTVGSTETGSMVSRESQSRLSNGSPPSSRLSAHGLPQGGVRLSNDNSGLRRYHARERSRSSQSTVVVSPVAEPGSGSLSQLLSNP